MKRPIKLKILMAVIMVIAVAGAGEALARSAKITSGLFLGYNKTHQNIYVSGLMDGESKLVSQCAPNTTSEQMTDELIAFMRANPRYMQRAAHLAFREMLVGKCSSKQ